MKRILYLILASIAAALLYSKAEASVQYHNYAERIGQAETIADNITEGKPTANEILSSMIAIKGLIPVSEEIEFRGSLVRVDNRWLHEAVDKVISNVTNDNEERWSMLLDVYFGLSLLHDRLEKSESPAGVQNQNHKAQLEQILARPEYHQDELKESKIRKWIDKLFFKGLRRIFSDFEPESDEVPTGSVMVSGFRIFLLVLLFAALIYGLYKLMKRAGPRLKYEEENGSRQVLGEEIEANSTPAELFARASELASRGDYRSAIRRAYIALLFELEQRGKLRLHRSKTNRDYLEAIRREQLIFHPFSTMTRTFENVWYGQAAASGENFEEFVNRYHETVAKSRDL
jgi:Domain of unknown function (DUF4129)